MKSIEISARTVAEAIQLALAQLGKDRDEVAIEVLEAGSADEEALVRVTAVDDDDEIAPEELAPPLTGNVDQIARRILEDLLERMDIQGYVTAVHSTVPGQKGEPEDTITLHVEGADEEAMGLLIGIFAAMEPVSNNMRLFLATGIIGGFTTFSAFSLDALTLWERGEFGFAILYVAASVLLSLAAVAAGFFLTRVLP